MNYKIGDKIETGYIFDIRGDTIFECALEDLEGKYDWNIAKKICEDNIDGWRLPTKDELNLMYENLHKKGVGSFADGHYWSFSEYCADIAWDQYFANGSQYYCYYYKSSGCCVRCVRSYKIDVLNKEI